MSERDLAEQLSRARDELERARVQAEAFTHLSHEIRTLLNGVIGITSLLLDTDLEPEQRDYAKRIRSSGDAIQSLLNNILDYSRMEATKVEIDRVDFDLRRTVDEVGELLAERAHAKGIELVVIVPQQNPGPLRGDPARLRQILINLVSNGIKFTDRGEVVLRVAAIEDAGETVSVRFEVGDTGVGISPAGQAKLFRPFSQVHDADRGYGGTGLGLALAKRLVEAMDGAIGVRSQLGKGSTFFFTVRFDRRAAPPSVGAIPRVDVVGRRVLIAAASEVNRRNLREMVEPLGVECALAAEGEAALLLLRDGARAQKPFDAAILDAALTDMDGGALVQAIRADERLVATKIVAMRYPGQAMIQGEGGEDLSASYLFKPVRQPQLHACLLRLMSSAVETITATGRAAELKDEAPASTGFRRRGATGPRPPPESSVDWRTQTAREGGRLAAASTREPPSSGKAASSSPVSPASPIPPAISGKHGAGGPISTRPPPSTGRGVPPPPRSPAAMPMVSLAEAVRRSLADADDDDRRPRVLLVEDNAVNQRVGVVMVEKRGYRVDVASNGFEAIEAALRAPYVAVLMDCQMPKLDGYSATAHIRRREAPGRRTPIIAMTADAGPGAREKCIAAGMDDYMAKPIANDELDRLLDKWAPIRTASPDVSTAPPPAEPPPSSRSAGRAPFPPAPSAPVRRPSSPAQRQPPIDLGVLGKLRAMRHGDPDLVLEVIDLFLQDAPERVAALRDGFARGDLPLVARVAHTLKGSAGHLGAKALSSLCGRVEEKARAGAPLNAAFALSSIEEEVGRVREALLAEATRLRDAAGRGGA